MNKREVIINNKTYNTLLQQDRIFIGEYFEDKFYEYFIKNINDKLIHISKEKIYSPYDFYLKDDNNIYLIELKTRLGNIDNHDEEIIDHNKLNKILKISNEYKTKTINIIFIFNHIEHSNGDDNKFYIYKVDMDYLKTKAIFLYDVGGKPIYKIKTSILSPLEEYEWNFKNSLDIKKNE